jgi:hypothetical protein
MVMMSPPLGGVSETVRSTIWRSVPPDGFAAAVVAAIIRRMAMAPTTSSHCLRMCTLLLTLVRPPIGQSDRRLDRRRAA